MGGRYQCDAALCNFSTLAVGIKRQQNRGRLTYKERVMAEYKGPKVNDRVKNLLTPRCLGVVKEVHEEVIGSSGDTRDKAVLVKVLWDNGTLSYFSPEALEVVAG